MRSPYERMCFSKTSPCLDRDRATKPSPPAGGTITNGVTTSTIGRPPIERTKPPLVMSGGFACRESAFGLAVLIGEFFARDLLDVRVRLLDVLLCVVAHQTAT